MPWVPVALGVCALVALLIVAAVPFVSSPEPQLGPAPQPFLPAEPPAQVDPSPSAREPAPARPSSAGVPAEPTQAGSAAGEPTVTTAPPRRPSPSRTTPAQPSPVTGRYRVLDSFDDGFVGEVRISNTSGRDSDWVVRLRFPANVGELITSWVESAPQATLSRAGDRYVWSSGAPVPAHGAVELRFHFARSGTGNLPSACTVNGEACSGLA
jgi:hypothetical protein